MLDITPIGSATSPEPNGHYSHAVRVGDLLFTSGQLAIDGDGLIATGASIESQVQTCLANLKQILKAANAGVNDVVKTTVYISDMQYWGRVDSVYIDFFGEHRPARAIVPVNKLHYGLDVEIEAIALLRD